MKLKHWIYLIIFGILILIILYFFSKYLGFMFGVDECLNCS